MIDIRGASGGSSAGGRSSLPIPAGLAGAGGGVGLLVVLVIVGINMFSGGGGDGGFSLPSAFGPGAGPPGVGDGGGIPPSEDPQADLKDFSSYVFTDTQDVWEGILAEDGSATSAPSWSSTPTPSAPVAAATRPPQSGPSTARRTSASTST